MQRTLAESFGFPDSVGVAWMLLEVRNPIIRVLRWQTARSESKQYEQKLQGLRAGNFVLATATVAVDGECDHHQHRDENHDDGYFDEGQQDSDDRNQLLKKGNNQEDQSDDGATAAQKT